VGVAGVFVTVAVLALAGAFLRRSGRAAPALAPRLSSWAINVTLPLGIFAALHVFALTWASLGPALATIGLTLALWGLSEGIGRALGLTGAERACFVLAVTFANTAFLGFPICRAIYGEEGFAAAVLIDQVGAEPLSVVVGSIVASRGASGRASIDWRKELKGLATFPPLVALVLGIAWKGLELSPLPAFVVTPLEFVSSLTVPLVSISLGLSLRMGKAREARVPVAVASALRLVVSPLLAWGVAWACGFPALELRVLTVEFAMPTMMFTLVLALRAGLDAELAAAFVGVSTVASLVSLPVWIALLG